MINSKFAVIIVAGGKGSRMGSKTPKQYLPLNGKMIIEHSIETFLSHENCEMLHIVIAEDAETIFKPIAEKYDISYSFGGDTRQESVYLGLEEINLKAKELDINNILIHDAARPLVSSELITDILDKLQGNQAVLPIKNIADTIKKLDEDNILKTIDRKSHGLAETPQGFNFNQIYLLHQKYKKQNFTDDISLCEQDGVKIAYVISKSENYKITTEIDYRKVKRELEIMDIRVGNGFDVHQFEDGNGVILCGIKIPYHKKLKGHSDADCAWHALTDAILGAIGGGDIGELFPDSDNQWKGADSSIFLKKAEDLMKEKNYVISNIDITIISEEPKLKPYKSKMVENTAKILNISKEQVNVKATTTEKLGFLGRKEGLAASATVCIRKEI